MIKLITGNIIESHAEALVNPVNCVGVMGKGLALQFKIAFPDNFMAYKEACSRGDLKAGHVFIFKGEGSQYIVNFPTKRHWKDRSRIEDIEAGLISLTKEVKGLGIKTIAIPPIGCGLGGLNWVDVRPKIEKAFDSLPNVVVWLYCQG